MSNAGQRPLEGMVLTVEDKPPCLVETLAQIHIAIDMLTPRGGPGFLILEAVGEDYAQVAGGDGVYAVEWREHGGGTFKHWVAGRAGQPSIIEVTVPTNGAEVIVKQNERLDTADVKVILTAFAEHDGRPPQYAWRDMTNQFLPEIKRSIIGFLKRLVERPKPVTSTDDIDSYATLTLPFPTVVVQGDHALAERLRSRAPGITPLVLGDRADVEWLEHIVMIDEGGLEAILVAAGSLDVDDWIAATLNERAADAPLPSGGWPVNDASPMSLGVHLDWRRQHAKPKVIIGLVPTSHSWEAPAYLRFGDWNDCPPPHVHAAMHKRWHERFGADIVSISGDVLECTVATPPRTRDEALVLAREQYAYCSDIVDQGGLSIEALAATLMKSEVWSFWWD